MHGNRVYIYIYIIHRYIGHHLLTEIHHASVFWASSALCLMSVYERMSANMLLDKEILFYKSASNACANVIPTSVESVVIYDNDNTCQWNCHEACHREVSTESSPHDSRPWVFCLQCAVPDVASKCQQARQSVIYIYVFRYGTYTHTHIYIYMHTDINACSRSYQWTCQTHVFTGVNTWSAHISVDTDVHFANKYVTTNVSRNVRLLVFDKTILMECIAQNEVIVLTSGSMKTLADEGGGPQIVILPMTHGCQYFVK